MVPVLLIWAVRIRCVVTGGLNIIWHYWVLTLLDFTDVRHGRGLYSAMGVSRNALYSVDLPVKLAGGFHFLRTHVVSGDTPLLVGRRSMTRMRMCVDTATNSVTVNLGAGDRRLPCTVSWSGYQMILIWDLNHRKHA